MYVYIYRYMYIYKHIYVYTYNKCDTSICSRDWWFSALERVEYWPLHDIVITDIVWCIAYKREVGRGVLYSPVIVNSIAPGWAMQVGGGNERMVDSCTIASKYIDIL